MGRSEKARRLSPFGIAARRAAAENNTPSAALIVYAGLARALSSFGVKLCNALLSK